MASNLCVTMRFLQPYSHGRNESGDPEWPPSPLRLLQALAAASAGRWNERMALAYAVPALHWLETLPPPTIIAAHAVPSEKPHRLYVPDNVADKVAAAWSRGRDASIADYRTEKDVCPAHLDGDSVHYLFPLPTSEAEWRTAVDVLIPAARSITHLGWGIDMAVGDANVITDEQAAALPGRHWLPSRAGGTPLRTAKSGTLNDLIRKHADFLGRLTHDGFRPVPPLRVFDVVYYRRQDDPVARPNAVFKLRHDDGSLCRYSQRKLMHIAGMVRHLAKHLMLQSPPAGVDGDWVERHVVGHRDETAQEHRQFSYLPLPSIGHRHADQAVRRVMIAAPVGDDAWLEHLARRLELRQLVPKQGDEFGDQSPPTLVRADRDNVARCYTAPANRWASVTPVVLPGHDDHKPDKTRKLIEAALTQSGIDQPCTYEWGAFSRFRHSLSAHKYDRDKRPTGYLKPDHLQTLTAVHLTLTFNDALKPPGPLTIGAGRHCGFGLMAGIDHE